MFDGVFLKYMINEVSSIIKLRVNKISFLNETDFVLNFKNKTKLLITQTHLRFINQEITPNQKITNFQRTLKKYFESSYFTQLEQFENDRILIIHFSSYDELGYQINSKLVIEFFNRNFNIILTSSDDIIIDSYKRCVEDEVNTRSILPKYKYKFPQQTRVNPYTVKYNNQLNFQGVSNLLLTQIQNANSLDVLYSKVKPTLFTIENKRYFYCFDLDYLVSEKQYFNSLSELLDYYYNSTIQINSSQKQKVINYIKKEIDKNNLKISKQKNELITSQENLKYLELGNLLKSNLHLIKKGMHEIKVFNFYDNSEITLKLNYLLTPSDNLKVYFSKYQKAKRAIEAISIQIEKSIESLKYFNTLLEQIEISRNSDELEIINELNLNNKKTVIKKSKPNYLEYTLDEDSFVLVGKNNIQNNYITHKLANKSDYFFHVKDCSGSHVILKTTSLTPERIEKAAMIASYYSVMRDSTKVNVCYTLVSNLKKVPGIRGSFVTYSSYKSVVVTPSIEFLKKPM